MKNSINRIILAVFLVSNVSAQNKGPFIKSRGDLLFNKSQIDSGNIRLNRALESLKKEVQIILNDDVEHTVVDSKKPSSIKPNDYYSLARYEWPNPNKIDGLPYVGIDGKVNPETFEYHDREKLNKISNYISKLSVLYFYTKNEELVYKAKRLITVFFITDETMMNPNLNYSQITKGEDGTSGGNIVDANGLIKLIDGIKLLEDSENWSYEIKHGLESWFSSYLSWLLNSSKGKKNIEFNNNVAVYYTAQVVTVALFLNKNKFARRYLIKNGKLLINEQINKDGELINEYKRAIKDEYIQYSFNAFDNLNSLAEHLGFDLYNYQNRNTGGLKKLNEWVVNLYYDDHGKSIEDDFSKRLLAHILISKMNKKDRTMIPKLDQYLTTMQILSIKE